MAILRGRRAAVIAVLAVGIVVALLFGGRAAWRLAHRFDRPPPVARETDVAQIAGWMSLRYVARAYRVPPDVLFEATGAVFEGRGPKSIDTIAAESGRSSDEVLAIVRETVAAWQADHPPPERGAPKPEGPRPDGSKPDRGAP